MKNPLFFLLGLLLLLSACDETEELAIDYKYDYFPLEIGKYITYSVDSITYSTLNGNIVIDTGSYQIRETVVDTFTIIDTFNNTITIGPLVYEVERKRRKNAGDAWQIETVLAVHRGANRLEWTENNRKFIKMFFPLKSEKKWNGNLYFDETELVPVKGEVIEVFKAWESNVTAIDEPYSYANFDFDSTMVISQANSENVIEYRYSTERYARGIGLIEKEMKILDTQCITPCANDTWEQKAEKGFIFRMTMIDHN